ncbi:hypothetical protein [Streptacidiphilus cavernicola]|uniref:CchlP n=1 Tax=Streptacidiphilus cavernicola TaxID=3342716 RepID=A0ABV6VWG0_9ACTN
MDAELAGLVGSGATTIVGLMATDLWTQTRDRIGRLFARGADPAAVTADLEASRTELVAARQAGDETAVADVEAEWRSRLRRVLQSDPAAAAELRALLDEVGQGPAEQQGTVVNNTLSGGVVHGTVIMGRDMHGGQVFHAGPGPAAR